MVGKNLGQMMIGGLCLIAGFYCSRQGVVALAAGNLELRPACWSPSRGSVDSDSNGHSTVVSIRGGPQVCEVGSIGIVPIWHVCLFITAG